MSKESDEKRELLKLKQGIISESEVIEQDVHEQPEKQTVAKKIDNFFFRNKWFVAAGAFFAAAATNHLLRKKKLSIFLATVCFSGCS